MPPDGTGRLRTAGAVLGGSVRGAIAHVRSADPRLLGAFAWWGFDMAVLYGMLNAFGAAPPFAVVVLAYFVGQVANTVPVPGAASGGLVGVLLAFGVTADLAIVSVLAYRAVAIWLPAPIGLVALGSCAARWRAGRARTPRGRAAGAPRRSARARRRGRAPARRRGGRSKSPPRHDPAPAGGAAGRRVRGGARLRAHDGRRDPELPDLEAALTDLADTLGTWTYALVGALAFLETGAFVGLVAPGETAVVLGGVVAAQGEVELPVMLLLVWLAAAAGDLASFAARPPAGAPLPRRPRPADRRHGRRAWRASTASSTATAPRRSWSGASSASCARWRPFLAGASGMRLRAFLPWSLLGTAAWAATFTLVGYIFHRSFSAAADYVTHGAFGARGGGRVALAWRAHRLQRSAA